MEWVEGFYDERVYQGESALAQLNVRGASPTGEVIASSIFANLQLTAAEVLQG